MKRIAVALSITGAAGACATAAHDLDRVRPGMTPQQVAAIIGPPEAVTHAPGKQCSYYALLKDFWSRVPWSVNDRYYVCYDDGKVESFGRVDAVADSGWVRVSR